MSKKRTKKQKQIIQLRRRLQMAQSSRAISAAKPEPEIKASPNTVAKNTSAKEENIYYYDPLLIRKDLFKTLLISLFLLALIGTIYYLINFSGVKIF